MLGRSAADPFLTASPCVVREGGRWRMWYVSCDRWSGVAGEPRHRYHVQLCRDGRTGSAWTPDGRVALDLRRSSEYALARPCVVQRPGGYVMWFSSRGDAYRIGRR